MKTELTMALIKRLKELNSKSVGVDAKGDLVFEPNPSGKDYIVYDASQEAPPGFGVRIAKKKTFIIRRKVHGKSFMPTVGNVADFMADTKSAMQNARAKAAKMALEIVETRANPNETARKRSAAELTLGEAFDKYRHHLATRTQRPATKRRCASRTARRANSRTGTGQPGASRMWRPRKSNSAFKLASRPIRRPTSRPSAGPRPPCAGAWAWRSSTPPRLAASRC